MRAHIYFLFLGLLFLASCAKRADDVAYEQRLKLTALQDGFLSEDSLATRATEVKFQSGDAVGVYVHTSAVVGSTGSHSVNMKYFTRDEGRSWLTGTPLGSPLKTDKRYYSTAYYPYNEALTDPLTINHKVALDQSSVAGDRANNLENSDFMVALGGDINVRSGGEGSMTLIFSHILTKLVISVGIPSSIDNVRTLALKSVRIKQLNTSCNISLADGSVAGVSPALVSDIIPRLSRGSGAVGETSTWEAIVVPQVVAPATKLVEFICDMADGSTDSLSYTVPADGALTLRSGIRLSMMLGASSKPAFLTTVDFNNGDARSDVGMQIRVVNGRTWKVSSSNSWLTLSDKMAVDGGVYGANVSGTGTGAEQTIYVKVEANSGALTIPREATLTLSDSDGQSITYRVFQNYTLFGPTFAAWSIGAGGGQSRAIEAFTTNQTWVVTSAGIVPNGLDDITVSTSADGAPLELPYTGSGALGANALFMQTVSANNSGSVRRGKVVFEAKGSNPAKVVEIPITQGVAVLALDKAEQSVGAAATSATFNVTGGANQKGVKYTVSAGAGATSVAPADEQTIGVTTAYSGAVTVTFPANTDKANKKTIVATVSYAGGATLTHTITQAAAAPPTVVVGGARWTTANLTGNAGTDTGHAIESSPEGYGMFFKWGTSFVYKRESGTGDGGGWGGETTGAATSPSSSNTSGAGYDYAWASGGTNPGDPCQKLGTSYKTPTRAQWQALVAAGKSSWTTYNNIAGYFFGPKASSCNNTTLQDGCIFLPASGCRSYGGGTQYYQGSYGYYWSSSVYNSNYGYNCNFYSASVTPTNTDRRSSGFSVRCIDASIPTVTIAGTKWTTGNLTGAASTATGHQVELSPEGYGMFFKWGTSFVYKRESGTGDGGGWGSATQGAATSPSSSNTGGTGYDYAQGLGGGSDPGDPCQKLGSSYKTPTHAQWQALNSSGTLWSNYNNIPGRFFGPKASSCNNTTLQDGCIFLPASGNRYYNNGTQYYQGSYGYYWSSSVVDSNQGYYCRFDSGGVGPNNTDNRGNGFSVRCVSE